MKKFQPFKHWTTDFAEHGVFDHLNRLVAFDEWRNWPSCEDLATLMPYEIKNRNNKSIQFVPQKPSEDFSAVAYEERIFNTGQVPTRQNSWHDIFGALTWSLFPKSKAVINQLHVTDIQANGTQQRSKRRNALTLFDECGAILVTSNQQILDDLRDHQWHEAFINKRELWHKPTTDGIGVFQFGHANYEMMTKPYLGLTGKWLALDVSAELLGLPLNVQYRMIDDRLATMIANGILDDNSQLSPLPLLGVPRWYAENEATAFYDNVEYFRPKSK